MARSSATFVDGSLVVSLSPTAALMGCATSRALQIVAADIRGAWTSDARRVGAVLRWRVAGTALSRQRALGWFSWAGHSGRWAWVWLTPGREVVVVTTTRRRPALLALPLDWFAETDRGLLAERLDEWDPREA